MTAKPPPKKPAFTIKQNKWDNWYGYRNGKRVVAFDGGFTGGSQEERAKEWLRFRNLALNNPISAAAEIWSSRK